MRGTNTLSIERRNGVGPDTTALARRQQPGSAPTRRRPRCRAATQPSQIVTSTPCCYAARRRAAIYFHSAVSGLGHPSASAVMPRRVAAMAVDSSRRDGAQVGVRGKRLLIEIPAERWGLKDSHRHRGTASTSRDSHRHVFSPGAHGTHACGSTHTVVGAGMCI